MTSKMSVKIRSCDFGMGKAILFIHDRYDGKRFVAKPINLEFVEADPCVEIEPTLRITGEIATEFFKELAEEMDRNGIKTDNDFKIKGLLEAKEAHLQDMRKLVFDEK